MAEPTVVNRAGIFDGTQHSEDGGIPQKLIDSGTNILVEGGEFNFPEWVQQDKHRYKLSGTNYRVIEQLFDIIGAKWDNKVTHVKSGDIVICIRSAFDDTERTYEGTIIEILSAVNESCGCKHVASGATMTNHETGEKKKFLAGGNVPYVETINDINYRFIKRIDELKIGKKYQLSDIIRHEELFKKFPEYKKIITIFEDITDEEVTADSETTFKTNVLDTQIKIGLHFSYFKKHKHEKYELHKTRNPEYSKEGAMLHEIQHVLQFSNRRSHGQEYVSYLRAKSRANREDNPRDESRRSVSEKIENEALALYKGQDAEQEAMWAVDKWLESIRLNYGNTLYLFYRKDKFKDIQEESQENIYSNAGRLLRSKKYNNQLNTTKNEISNIISGKSKVRGGDAIQAVASYLRRSKGASPVVAEPKSVKGREEEILRSYGKIIPISDFKNQIGEGTEHRVYLQNDGRNVIKLNSSYFYNSWEDYFDNLLLHNYFFPDTAYKLIGFTEENGKLFSVVKQPFVKITNEPTDLKKVKKFLSDNGFINVRNDDYLNSKLGIILEDLHEQNIIIHNGNLFFIDTVFYLSDKVASKKSQGGQLPVINNEGGYDYTGKELKTADRVGLITLPKDIKGTNCSNCSFFKDNFCNRKNILLPVNSRMCCSFWEILSVSDFPANEKLKEKKYSLNEDGGFDYMGSGIKKAQNADLVTLPKKVAGTTCANCKYVDANNFCTHHKVLLPVTQRMTCSLWDAVGALRSWKGGATEVTFEDGKSKIEWKATPDMKPQVMKAGGRIAQGYIIAPYTKLKGIFGEPNVKNEKDKIGWYMSIDKNHIGAIWTEAQKPLKKIMKEQFHKWFIWGANDESLAILSEATHSQVKDIDPAKQKEKDKAISAKRWIKKREHIHELSNNIHKLKSNVSRDLNSEDEKDSLTALVIALMLNTAERVGNDDSADNGHFGCTGFQKEHLKVIGNKVLLQYTGKSGVEHEKSFSDKKVAKALKKAIKNSQSNFVFETSDGFRIRCDRVNRYLSKYGITAKDIRGYSANTWIVKKLEKEDKKLPEDLSLEKGQKERKKVFNSAVKKTALEVGHGASTLKKHYMIPELSDEYILHGRIIDMKKLGYYKEGGEIQMAKGGEIKDLKVYHGSAVKGLKEISFGKGIRSSPLMGGISEVESKAIFFTSNKEVADLFASSKVEYLKSIGKEAEPFIYERYITIKKPADFSNVESAEKILEELQIDVEDEILGTISSYKTYLSNLVDEGAIELSDLWQIADKTELIDKLKKAGYDGAIFQEPKNRGISYAIFNPSQAKEKPAKKKEDGGELESDNINTGEIFEQPEKIVHHLADAPSPFVPSSSYFFNEHIIPEAVKKESERIVDEANNSNTDIHEAWRRLPLKEILFKDIVPMQDDMNGKKLEGFIAEVAKGEINFPCPFVIKYQGKYYMDDGHHRAIALYMNDKAILAHVDELRDSEIKNGGKLKDKNLTLYHGTILKKISSIEANGLVSNLGYGVGWYMLSSDFASALFHANAQEGEDVPVIEFSIPKGNDHWEGYPYLWKEEKRDDNSSWYALMKPIPKEFIKKIHYVKYADWIKQKGEGFKDGGKITSLPAFKKWFADSKVVDKKGNPLVVYHGTKSDRFHEFSMSRLGEGNDQYGSGFYFSNRREVSEGYGENVYEVYLSIQNPINQKKRLNRNQIKAIISKAPDLKDSLYNFGDVDYEGQPTVLNNAVNGYLNYGAHTLDTLNAMSNDFFRGREDKFLIAVNDVLGYDGHIIELTPDSIVYVAFFPTQIKLADGSNTTFDPKNPDIRFDNGGGVGDEKITNILNVLRNNTFYVEHKLFSFIHLAPLVNMVMDEYLVYDEKNPIITRFNEAIHFQPSYDHIKREGIDIARIEYATHFITGYVYQNNIKKRQFDKSKFDAIQFLIPVLKSPDVERLYQTADILKKRQEAILYAKEITTDKGLCIILIAEITKEGVVRAVTFLPKDKCGYIQKQKASNIWLDASVISPFTEKPPFDEGRIKTTGGSIIGVDSYNKDRNNSHNNNEYFIELYNTDYQPIGDVVITDDSLKFNNKNVSIEELYNLYENNPQNNNIKYDNAGKVSENEGFDSSKKINNFTLNPTKDEIRNDLSGKSEVSNGDAIQTAISYLRTNESSGASGESRELIKTQEEPTFAEGGAVAFEQFSEEIDRPKQQVVDDIESAIAKLQEKYDKINNTSYYSDQLAKSFPMGRVGFESKRLTKLRDADLDRTITNAVTSIEIKKQIGYLENRIKLYKLGKVNEKGMPKTMSLTKLGLMIEAYEKALKSGELKGQKLTNEEIIILKELLATSKKQRKDKEKKHRMLYEEYLKNPSKKLAEGGLTEEKKKEAEAMAKKFVESLSAEDLKTLKQEFQTISSGVIVDEEKKLNDMLAKKQDLENEIKSLYEKEKPLEYGAEKNDLMKQRMKLRQDMEVLLAPEIIHQENVVKAVRNGGDLFSFSDKKDTPHSSIPYFVKVKTDIISFDEDTLLTDAVPPYIPAIDEKEFRLKGYVFDAIRIAPDQYLVAVNGYKENRISGYYSGTEEIAGHPSDAEQGYVVVTLDQLALISDYYFTKAKAQAQKEADESTARTEAYYDRLPRERREKHLGQKGFYRSLPASVKKIITEPEYEKLSLEEKEKLYKPFKKGTVKRLTSKLEDTQMWKSFHKMYERFVDPSKKELKSTQLKQWVDLGLISAESAEITAKKSPNQIWGHPEVFAYWKEFRDMMRWKIKDIKVQRESESEIRKIAVETSFGESNTDPVLKEKYGILVKRQNGTKIMPAEIEQIKLAWEKLNVTYGNLVNNAKEANLKISHTGLKYVFASKWAGVFIPQMKTIAVTNKFGDNQFEQIFAHETAHWIDYSIGQTKGKRWATDDFESTAGIIANVFRKNMNEKSDSDYINATKECFARAMEQYFAFENFGEDATLIFSGTAMDEFRSYHAEKSYLSKENFNNKVKPLITKFLSESSEWFNFGIEPEKDKTNNKNITMKQGGKITLPEIINPEDIKIYLYKGGDSQIDEYVRPDTFASLFEVGEYLGIIPSGNMVNWKLFPKKYFTYHSQDNWIKEPMNLKKLEIYDLPIEVIGQNTTTMKNAGQIKESLIPYSRKETKPDITFSSKELGILRDVYFMRLAGEEGYLSDLKHGRHNEYLSENNISKYSAIESQQKKVDGTKDDIKYLNEQKYPYDILNKYDAERFLDALNEIGKTRIGRERMEYKVWSQQDWYDLYEKVENWVEAKHGAIMDAGGITPHKEVRANVNIAITNGSDREYYVDKDAVTYSSGGSMKEGGELDWKEPIPLNIDYAGGRFESWYYLSPRNHSYKTGYEIDLITQPARRTGKFSYAVLTDSAKSFSGIQSNKIDLQDDYANGGSTRAFTSEQTSNGIPFTDSQSGIHGSAFILYPEPHHTKADIEKAKSEIKHQRDVVSIKVASDDDRDYNFKGAYFLDPRISDWKWYQIEQDDYIIRKGRKEGLTPSQFVDKYVLPFKKETEQKYKKQYGEHIHQMKDGGSPKIISDKKKKEFIEYVTSFYGKRGIYADFFKNDSVVQGKPDGASVAEIQKAVDEYLEQSKKDAKIWGGGDSIDRERVRDIMLKKRGLPSVDKFIDGGSTGEDEYHLVKIIPFERWAKGWGNHLFTNDRSYAIYANDDNSFSVDVENMLPSPVTGNRFKIGMYCGLGRNKWEIEEVSPKFTKTADEANDIAVDFMKKVNSKQII